MTSTLSEMTRQVENYIQYVYYEDIEGVYK